MIKKRTSRLLAVTTGISAAGFLLCAAHVMSVFSSYIYKFHATSLFQDTAAWLAGHFEKPAALLVYCGRFLTQFCYFPGVAILLLTGLYALISWLCYRYFLRGSALPVLSLLPALALYLSLMRMGYGVLVFRADALIFTEPVGILSALLLFRLLQAGEGNAHKPFLLPQRDPQQNIRRFKSYNIPEFTVEPVSLSPKDFLKTVRGPALQAEQ